MLNPDAIVFPMPSSKQPALLKEYSKKKQKTVYFCPGMLYLFLLWAELFFFVPKVFGAVFRKYHCFDPQELQTSDFIIFRLLSPG